MDRSTFLKSLFVLAASPKVLAELKSKPKPIINAGIFNDLRFVIPEAVPALLAKYNGENFMQLMQEIGQYDTNATFVELHWPEDAVRRFENFGKPLQNG